MDISRRSWTIIERTTSEVVIPRCFWTVSVSNWNNGEDGKERKGGKRRDIAGGEKRTKEGKINKKMFEEE